MPLEKALRASLEDLGVEVPAAAAAEREVPVSEALARVSPAFQLQIASFAEAREIATMLCKTQFVPQAYRGKPDEALAAIMMGGELGVGPMQALQGIAVINGKPTVWGDLALALVQIHPDFVAHIETLDAGKTTATCVVKRRNRPDVVKTFSLQDAAKAGLLGKAGTPWQSYPTRMLQMRARAWALRDQFADALRGLQILEEVRDYNADGGVVPANDVPTVTVRAQVVQPVAAPQPVEPAPQSAAQPVAAAPRPAVVTVAMPDASGADFVIPGGKNKGRRMGDMIDDAIRWYADDCKDPRTKAAATEVRKQRAVAAAERAQAAQLTAAATGADEQAPVWDPETGEVLQ